MVAVRSFALLIVLCCGCGGAVGSGDAGDSSLPPGDAGFNLDGPWYANFPDAWFNPDIPPVPGTYPPLGGRPCDGRFDGCYRSREYPQQSLCDDGSGWCCSGQSQNRKCACGWTLGCIGPAVCCAKSGETVPHCAPGVDACVASGGVPWTG